MAAALDGIRVLDMTVFQQGSYASAMLADMGADVIKIEGPETPDPGRGVVLGSDPSGLNAYFHTLNRGKRAISIDLKQPRGREVFYRLVENADVFVSNIRERALKKIGVDYKTLSRINPRLVYAIGSGTGPSGPDHDLGSMDILAQARGGLMSVTGEPEGVPVRAGVALADHVGAICLGFGIVTALFHRERTGEGQRVDGSLLAGQMCVQSHNITATLFNPVYVQRRQHRGGPNPTWSTYSGNDGKWFVLGMMEQRFWPGICRVIDRPDLLDHPRFGTLQGRLENGDELIRELETIFSTDTADGWVRRFAEADLMAARVNDYAEVANDAQVLANGYIREVPRGEGLTPVRMVGLPVQFSRTPSHIRGIGPEFGAHTEQVLLEAGLTWEEISELSELGVIGMPRSEVVPAG